MIKRFTKILGVIALTGWMGVANATLIFEFSWDSSDGKIIGEIYGLSDDGINMEATGFVLTSVGGIQVNISVFEDDGWQVFGNEFDVSDGELGNIYFNAVSNSPDIGAVELDNKYKINDFFNYEGDTFRYHATKYVSVVKRVTVPEPSSVILMLLGLVGLSFARYRKQY
jgi:hypothetical protein